jgi:hypothetical protein
MRYYACVAGHFSAGNYYYYSACAAAALVHLPDTDTAVRVTVRVGPRHITDP